MPKTKKLSLLHYVLMLFVFIVPVIGSAFEKRAVTYGVLCLFLVCLGYQIYKSASLYITRTSVFMTLIWLYGMLQLTFVSDKGDHFGFCSLFLVSAVSALLASDYKRQLGKENFNSVANGILYVGCLIYAIMAVLYQVFIKSSFLGCDMDFGSGSSAATAVVMVVGIVCAFKIFKDHKKRLSFIVPVIIMLYVFLMTKSLLGYLFGAVVVFAFAMSHKHKKLEAFAALLAVVVLAVLNGISSVAKLYRNAEAFNGAMKGLVSIVGVGKGGYNASVNIVDKGYSLPGPASDLMMEAFGVIGIGIMAICIWSVLNYAMKTRKFEDVVLAVLTVVVVLAPWSALVFMLPLISMYCAVREEGVKISVHKAVSAVFVLPVAFFLLLTLANIPYAIADHYCDVERYSEGAAYYRTGAKMELFNSHGWEKAYMAEEKAFEQNGYAPYRQQYLENAIRYNKKNYMYLRQLADVYTSEGNYIKALETWEIIMIRHDKEYLYPIYGEKIVDVMENCPVGLEKMEELYLRLEGYAKRAVDKEIVLLVNNILARSQQYYINTREGYIVMEDVYEAVEEIPTEVEYESSSAES